MAQGALAEAIDAYGDDIVPQEPLPPVGTLGFRVNNYGMLKWGDLFNARQLLALSTLARSIRMARKHLAECHGQEFATAVGSYVACLVDKHADYNATLTSWHYNNQTDNTCVHSASIGNGLGLLRDESCWRLLW